MINIKDKKKINIKYKEINYHKIIIKVHQNNHIINNIINIIVSHLIFQLDSNKIFIIISNYRQLVKCK